MAVVGSAADGLALSMPSLGLGLPRNFTHLSAGESDPSELHHTHHHYHHHHHLQLHHHQPLLHHQPPPKSSHIDEDQQALHNISSLVPQTEPRTQVNADGLTSIDEIATRKLTYTSSPAQKSAASVDITSNPTSADGITSKPQGDIGQPASQIKALVHTEGELGSETRLPNAVNHLAADNNSLESMYDQMTNMVNPQTVDGGKDLMLPINPHAANADSLTQSEKDSMRKLEDLLSKLNPLAKEFVPSSVNKHDGASITDSSQLKQKKNGYTQGRRRPNGKTSRAQREDSIRRTVYVSDIDQLVTEEQLAALFITCGPVIDCRVCGDPNSVLRFAFVEFTNEGAARAALGLAGTMLGYYPVRVLPSKTAIVPVNPTFLPRSEDEREMCARTVYCTNIDKKVSQADVKLFFETLCGEVARLRLLGDYRHSTRIAFVEFMRAESAMAALNCSGAVLGSMPLRVSPSKTPVRPRSPRFL